MPRSVNKSHMRSAGAVLIAAATLTACSDLYLDRRETVSLGAADAVATNKIVQTIDPWPPAAADRRYAFDGDKMRSAAARYRTGKIIQPQGLGTTSAWRPQAQTESGGAIDSTIGSAGSAAGR
jgi:hypothetical protein